MEQEPIEAVKNTAASVEQTLQRNVDELEQRVQSTRDRVHDFNEHAVQFIQERPAAALGIAFGVGYIVGKLAAKRWLV